MERNILPCLLVCLIHICLCSAVAPNVNFTCDSSNSVVFLKKDNNLDKLRVVLANGSLCKPTSEDFKNCNVQNHSDIRVLYTEEKNELIAGGKNLARYEVMCKDQKQVVKVSVTDIQITESTTPNYSPKSLSPNILVKMVVKKNGTLLGNTAVSIGEQLTLQITGPGSHKIRPENCTASDGNLQHTIWKPCGHHDEAIIGKDWNVTANILTNDLYAFRFINTKKVNIECYLSVCPDTSNECKPNTCSTTGRRRRGADDFSSNDGLSSKEAVASVSFNVKSDQTFNKSPGLLADVLLFTVAVFTAMLSIR